MTIWTKIKRTAPHIVGSKQTKIHNWRKIWFTWQSDRYIHLFPCLEARMAIDSKRKKKQFYFRTEKSIDLCNVRWVDCSVVQNTFFSPFPVERIWVIYGDVRGKVDDFPFTSLHWKCNWFVVVFFLCTNLFMHSGASSWHELYVLSLILRTWIDWRGGFAVCCYNESKQCSQCFKLFKIRSHLMSVCARYWPYMYLVWFVIVDAEKKKKDDTARTWYSVSGSHNARY